MTLLRLCPGCARPQQKTGACPDCHRARDQHRARTDPYRRITSTAAWQKARAAARARAGDTCEYQHLPGPCGGRLEVHHIRPIREGGHPTSLDNLACACRHHHEHAERHARTGSSR